MGQMKRAEERERQRRIQMQRTYFLVLTWRRENGVWLANFLDNRSRLPLTYQRVYRNAATIRGLVERSLTDMASGPRAALFLRRIQAERGEIEIEVTSEQYVSLLKSGAEKRQRKGGP